MPKTKKKPAKAVPPMKRSKGKTTTPALAPKAAAPKAKRAPKVNADRDPRLPKVGTVLRKTHRGIEHEITVLADGFEWNGQTYRSLSKIANEITGTTWNGFLWLGLVERAKPAPKASEPSAKESAALEAQPAPSPAVQP